MDFMVYWSLVAIIINVTQISFFDDCFLKCISPQIWQNLDEFYMLSPLKQGTIGVNQLKLVDSMLG